MPIETVAAIEVIRLAVEVTAIIWVLFRGVRVFAALEADVRTMRSNDLPHLATDVQQLNKRIDDLVTALVNRP